MYKTEDVDVKSNSALLVVLSEDTEVSTVSFVIESLSFCEQ